MSGPHKTWHPHLCPAGGLWHLAVFTLLWMPAVGLQSAVVEFSQISDPIGILVQTNSVDAPANVTTVTAPTLSGLHSFTHWTVNGSRVDDETGRSQNPARFFLEAPTLAIAHYLPTTQDTEPDGIPDWYEIEHYDTLTYGADSDTDTDGFTLLQELGNGFHPRLHDVVVSAGLAHARSSVVAIRSNLPPVEPPSDAFVPGGLARGRSSLVSLNLTLPTYTLISSPLGFLDVSDVVTNGTVVVTPDYWNQIFTGYRFAYWDLNGTRQEGAYGIALGGFSFVVTNHMIAIAHFFPEALDSDSDGVADWFEYVYYPTLEQDGNSDSDGDGLTLSQELAQGTTPTLGDDFVDGGISRGRAAQPTMVDLRQYWLDTQAGPGGSVIPTNDWYAAGTEVDVEAIADSGYQFVRWLGSGTNHFISGTVTSASVSVEMTGPIQLVATFEPLPRIVRVIPTSAESLGVAQAVIQLIARGDETALGFSLEFNPDLLSFSTMERGSDAAGGTLQANATQTGSGRLGLGVSLPVGQAFPAGTQEIARVFFDVSPVTTTQSTMIAFGDLPTARQVVDALALDLPTTYENGAVLITPAQYEGDVAPRPNGNYSLSIADWVQVGRFVAALDTPATENEFMRADCAPRSSLGNGQLAITDWVQAGRYALGVDPLTPIGAPSGGGSPSATASGGGSGATGRELHLNASSLKAGQENTVTVELQSLGDENALGFSVSFDPTRLALTSAQLGPDATGASLYVNTNSIAAGSMGVAMALPYPSTFTNGTQQVVILSFDANADTSTQTVLAFGDTPVWREISDFEASPLSAAYAGSTVTITPLPTLSIELVGDSVRMSWLQEDDEFTLQSALTADGLDWADVVAAPSTNSGANSVILPITNSQALYRLIRN